MKLDKSFFVREPSIVAQELLGKILVRVLDGKILKSKIVETEAYFDEEDPASRARQNGDLRVTMQMDAGTVLVYGVHNSWLINFVTENVGKASAVLIRAIEPINFEANTRGPGLLTSALGIKKDFHKKSVIDSDDLWIEEGYNRQEIIIVEKFRVGVNEDLPEKMRFYIQDNNWISEK